MRVKKINPSLFLYGRRRLGRPLSPLFQWRTSVMAEQQGNSGQVEEVETPMLVLWRWRWFMWMVSIGIFIGMICFLIDVMLVLRTGDYRSMVAYNERLPFRNILLYYLEWLVLLTSPIYVCWLQQLGSFYFYKDRLELAPWYRSNKAKRRVIPYEMMHVLLQYRSDENIGLLVTKQSIQDCTHPLLRFKLRHWDAFSMPFGRQPSEAEKREGYSSVHWSNPNDVPKAVELLRENAVSFH